MSISKSNQQIKYMLAKQPYSESIEEETRSNHDTKYAGRQSTFELASMIQRTKQRSLDVESNERSTQLRALGASRDSHASSANIYPPGLVKNQKTTVSTRLAKRTELYKERRILADVSMVIALFGIVLMIIENELTDAKLYDKTSVYSYSIKSVILVSTIVLLMLILRFHVVEVLLFMNDNSAEDWRIAMTSRRWTQLFVELAVCAFCPVPGNFTFRWHATHADGETVTNSYVSYDVLLSILMFLRLYLIWRVMLLHSKMFTDASSRSIGALNRVNFNSRFVLKTLMYLCPGTVLFTVTASYWVIAAWVLRCCERHHSYNTDTGEILVEAQKHENYLNSLWLIAITFLSVGYGDIVPNTYCGRGISVISGIMGVSTSSLVVAVIARKLELTRAEKHVHTFMMDTQLTKRLKHAAANVLRETWLIYKYRRLVHKIDVSKIRQHQRKFLMAIYELRKVKRDQRKLAENAVTIGDIAKTATSTYELLNDITEWQEGVGDRLTGLESQLKSMQSQLAKITDLMTGRPGVIDFPPIGPRRRQVPFTGDLPQQQSQDLSTSSLELT